MLFEKNGMFSTSTIAFTLVRSPRPCSNVVQILSELLPCHESRSSGRLISSVFLVSIWVLKFRHFLSKQSTLQMCLVAQHTTLQASLLPWRDCNLGRPAPGCFPSRRLPSIWG